MTKEGRESMFVHDRMLELMEAEGIKTLIGIPDPSFVQMFVAAEARGWRVIAPHHEQAGAFIADGMWRMTGTPGVVVGNQGPGIADLAPAAICAAKENTPTVQAREDKAREKVTADPKFQKLTAEAAGYFISGSAVGSVSPGIGGSDRQQSVIRG